MSQLAGIVLCGGRSRRMGRAKESLPFGPETMLARVVRRLSEAVERIVVVGGVGQELPELPSPIAIACDRQADRGPLEGLAVGLHAIADRAEIAFVTACDVPLLMPEFIRRMVRLLDDHDVAVPHVDGRDHPLSAAYRTAILPQVEGLLSHDRLRPADLFDLVRTRRVTADELTDVDPHLHSLVNVNGPEEYRTALKLAGLES